MPHSPPDSRLIRVLEPEVMDSLAEAVNYDAMDHAEVNRRFVANFLEMAPDVCHVLDLGTGTAQIPIELCRQNSAAQVVALDAARHMLDLAAVNLTQAGLADRVELALGDSKRLPYADAQFTAVMSNSIIHHIPEPRLALAEAVRVVRPGGLLFFRDLMRPLDGPMVNHLVDTYAAGASPHQRQMFDDSLRAALTLSEIRDLVAQFGFAPETVQATSDRHWTWATKSFVPRN